MQKNFTKLIAHFLSAKRYTVPAGALFLLLTASLYVWANVGVTVSGGASFPISADLAVNSDSPTKGFSPVGDIVILEGADGDFFKSGNLILTAPTGWVFKQSGVTTAVVNGLNTNGNTNTNVLVDNTKIGHAATTITIPFSVDKTNQRDKLTISGIEVQAINGGNMPGLGNIALSLSNGAVIAELPATVSKTLSQTHGAARKIAFGPVPGSTLTGNTISPSPTVLIQDQFGNTVTSGTGADASVTVAIGTNPAGSNGVLNGTTTFNAVNGVATFSGLSIDAAGAGYTLAASTDAYGNATSSAFNINSKVPTLNAPTACVSEGDGNTTITLTGTNFEKNSVGYVNDGDSNSPRSTTFISSTELEITLLEEDLKSAGDISISVLNPAPPADNVSDTRLLNIKPLLHASSIVGEGIVCAGTQVLYTAPEGFSDFEWSSTAGGTVEVSGDNPALVSFLPTAPSTVTISLSAKNACGVASSASIVVDVKPAPQAVIEYNSTSFCENGSLELRAFINPSELDDFNYEWFKLGSDDVYELVGDNSPAYVTEEAGTFRLTVTGENSDCSQTSDAVVITVNPLPTVSITGLGSEYCSSDQAVTLAGSPVGGTFRILQGTTVVDEDATTFNPSALDAGDYLVEYSYADENTCVNTTTQTVTVKPQPVLTISNDSPGGICPGESAVLTASGADSYEWSPSTGLSATTGASVTATPTVTTTYTIIGTTNGCESEAKTVTVTVNPLPDVTIRPTGPTEFCLESGVNLGAVDNPAYKYQWFKDGVPISGADEHSLLVQGESGTGKYHVTITTDAGCELSSEAIAVKVADVPKEATIITTGATTFCQGGSVKFDANKAPAGQTYVYQWQKSTTTTDDADFTNIEGAVNSSLVTNESGYYRVLVSNTKEADEDTALCTKTSAAVGVTVYPQPEATVTGEDQFQCAVSNGSNSFTVTGTFVGSGATWTSNNPDFEIIVQSYNIEEGQTTAIVTTTGAGNAIISLRANRSSTGCTEAIATQSLTVHPLPVATINAGGPTTFCEGGSVELTASEGSSWLWSTGEKTQSIIVDESGDYSVKVFNSNGCSLTSAATTVTENELPTVTLAAFEPVCKNGDSFTLSGGLPVGGTYTVDGVAATQFNPATTAVGNHTIEYTYQDDNNCSASATQTIVVKAVPTVTLGTFADVCVGAETVTLSGGLPEGGTYTVDGVIATQFNPASAGVGTHTITYSYEENGCTNTATSTIKVTPVPTATLSAFSNVCANAAAFALTGGSPAGGTYMVDGVTATQFNPASAGVGTHTITYSYEENGCAVSTTGTITVNPLPIANAGNDQTKCATGNSTSFTLAGAVTNGTGQWKVLRSTGTASATIAAPGQLNSVVSVSGAGTVTLQLTTASNTTPACGTATDEVVLTVNPLPTVNAGTNKSNCQAIANGTPSSTTFAMNGSSSAGSSVKWSVFSQPSSVSAVSFSNINSPTSNVTITGYGSVVLRLTATGTGECTAFSDVTINVSQRKKLTLVLEADPFPVCPGTITRYKATVYENAEVVWNVDRRDSVDVTSFGRDVSDQFVFDWWKNDKVDNQQGQTGRIREQAGLSSTDYYTVRASLKAGSTLTCNYFEQTFSNELSGADLYSNRIYLGYPEGYGVKVTANPGNVICAGTPVTFTATANATYADPVWQWQVNGKNVQGETSNTFTTSTLKDGDKVNVLFGSAESICGLVPVSNEITMTVNALPAITSQPTTPRAVCAGQTVELTVGASGSGITYQWYKRAGSAQSAGSLVQNGGRITGATSNKLSIAGTVASDAGFYYVVVSGICAPVATSNNTELFITPIPIAYNVTGTGSYCQGGTGVLVGLSDSETGVSYQLLLNGSIVQGAVVIGTGDAISFGNRTAAGTYTVLATTISGATTAACPRTMTGSAVVTVNSLPAPQTLITPRGTNYCADKPGVPVGLGGSQSGVVYTLRNSTTNATAATVNGTGAAVNFPADIPAGTYTVTATNLTTNCPSSFGNVTITETPLPNQFTVTGGGEYCAGGNGVAIGLDGSQVGITYTLMNGATAVESVTRDAAGPFSFNNQLVAGTYTVVASNDESQSSEAACQNQMLGSAQVSVTPLTEVTDATLQVVWNKEMTQWTVTAFEKDQENPEQPAFEYDFGDNPTFVWYRRESSSPSISGEDWFRVVSTESNVLVVTDPKVDTQIKVEILNNATCTLYRLHNIGVSILPVEIIYLNASKQGNDVVLEWATAMEEDNAGFEVQVSTDGFSYRKLTFVPAKNGNSNMKQEYAFTDRENGKFGTRYYRLKQLDTYGTFEFFGPKAVTFGSVASKVIAFPNPFHDEVTLDIAAEADGEALITMTDAVGKKLLERKVQVEKGFTTEKLRLDAGLPRGLYIIKVQVGGFTQYIKMIKE